MKRFMVFVFDDCYPQGGMNDLAGSSDTLENCNEILISKIANSGPSPDSYHIYDSVENKLVTKQYADFNEIEVKERLRRDKEWK